MFNYRYGIVCNEKYFYEIEADNVDDALAVAKEFFENDYKTSYRTGSVEWKERISNVSCN